MPDCPPAPSLSWYVKGAFHRNSRYVRWWGNEVIHSILFPQPRCSGAFFQRKWDVVSIKNQPAFLILTKRLENAICEVTCQMWTVFNPLRFVHALNLPVPWHLQLGLSFTPLYADHSDWHQCSCLHVHILVTSPKYQSRGIKALLREQRSRVSLAANSTFDLTKQ